MNLMKAACHELGEASRFITHLAQKPIRERLAEVLLLLKENFGVDQEQALQVVLTREEIASLVGTATESVIRLLSDFNQEGLVRLEGKRIHLINIPGLIKTGKVYE
jgi:CRP-like cAMP-binding protein